MPDYRSLNVSQALEGLRTRSWRDYARLSDEDEPGVLGQAGEWLSAGVGAVGDVLHAPKRVVDIAANWWSNPILRERVLRGEEPIPSEELVTEALFPSEDEPSYLKAAARATTRLGTSLATDPLIYALGAGAMAKAPSIAQRALSGYFAGTMATGAVQEATEAGKTVAREGFSPQALEQSLGAAGAGLFALGAGKHALFPKKPQQPPKNAWEAVEQRTEARRAPAPAREPERALPEVWEGEEPGRRPELEQEALRLDEEIYGGELPRGYGEEFVPVDRAVEADFLRPDVEARVAGEQARLGREYREQTPASVAESMARAEQDLERPPQDLELEALRRELEAELSPEPPGRAEPPAETEAPRPLRRGLARRAAEVRLKELEAEEGKQQHALRLARFDPEPRKAEEAYAKLEALAQEREHLETQLREPDVGEPETDLAAINRNLEAGREPPPEIGAQPRAQELEALRRELEGELAPQKLEGTLEGAIEGALGAEPGGPRLGRPVPALGPAVPERRVAERPGEPRRPSPERPEEPPAEVEPLAASFLVDATPAERAGYVRDILKTAEQTHGVEGEGRASYTLENGTQDVVFRRGGKVVAAARINPDNVVIDVGSLEDRAGASIVRDLLRRKVAFDERAISPDFVDALKKALDRKGAPRLLLERRPDGRIQLRRVRGRRRQPGRPSRAGPDRVDSAGAVRDEVRAPGRRARGRPEELAEPPAAEPARPEPAKAEPSVPRETPPEGQQRWPVRAVTPEEYARVEREPESFPREETVGHIEAATEAQALAAFQKRRGEFPEGAELGGLPQYAVAPKKGVFPAPDDIPRGVLDKMGRYMKTRGYDIRGSGDVLELLKKRDLLSIHKTWQDAYRWATGRRAAQAEKAGALKAATPHVNWETVRRLGTTSDPKAAGYIRPDGALLDMSGGGGRTRGEDHRIVGGTAGMQELMAAGHIRWMPEGNGFDISAEPTAKQFTRIRDLVERANGEVILDLEGGLGRFDKRNEFYSDPARKASLEYPAGTRPERVVGDIRRFFAGEDLPTGPRFAAAPIPSKAPFFSHLRNVVDKIKQKAGSAQDFLKFLSSPKQGVKAEELKWTGLRQFLEQRKGKVTKEEMQRFLDENDIEIEEVVKGSYLEERDAGRVSESFARAMREAGGETKFGQWQLPGGKEGSYRERLFILRPKKGEQARLKGLEQELREVEAEEQRLAETPVGEFTKVQEKRFNESRARMSELRQRIIAEDKTVEQARFTGGHWDEPGVVAHVRYNERVGPNGERILFWEEAQSDWHQAGKKEGYGTRRWEERDLQARPSEYEGKDWDIDIGDGEAVGTYSGSRESAVRRALESLNSSELEPEPGVPPAPFAGATKSPWHEMVVRRMVRLAAEEGFDKISWISGEETAKRYDLSKQISEVHYSGTNLKAYDLDGRAVIERTGVTPEELPGIIGKEPAERLMAQEPEGTLRSITGEDLKVGGEWAKNLYDVMIPSAMKKFGKQWGATVGRTDIRGKPRDAFTVVDQEGNQRGQFSSREEAEAFLRDPPEFVDPERSSVRQVDTGERAFAGAFQSLDITPTMRESVVEKGVPKFAPGKGKALAPAAERAKARATRARGIAAVKRALPGAKVTSHPDGVIFTMPNGKSFLFQPDASITVDAAAFEAGRGRAFKPGEEFIAGAFEKTPGNRVPWDGVMQLAGEAPRGTEYHEAYHAVKALALDAKQRADVERRHPGGEEVEADAFAAWSLKPTKHGPFQQILRFAKRLYRAFRPTAESRAERVFEEVRGGKVWEGKVGGAGGGPPKFAVAPLEPAPRGTYRAAEEGLGDRLIRHFQDKYVRLKRTVESVKERGGRATEETDPYLAVERFDSITAEKLRDAERKLADPLVAALAKPVSVHWRETATGRVSERTERASLEDLGDYMSLRHAPTRDAIIRERTKGENEHGSGWSPEEAAAAWDALESKYGARTRGKLEALEPLAKIVREAREETLRVMVDGGLISEAQAKGWKERFGEDYVPLRTAEVEAGPGTGQGFDIRGRESKSATGRTTKAANPVVFMMSQLQRAIVRAEKNKVDQAFAKFVEENPDQTLWERDVKHKRPEYDQASGEVKMVRDQLAERDDLAYKVDGESHRITVRDPLLQRAMKNLSAQETGELLRKVGGFTRFYSQMVTSWNPEFIVSNFARDIQQAIANVGVEQGAKIAKQIPKNVLPAMKGMWDVLRKPGGTGKWATYAKELREDGGTIGFYFLKDIPALEKQMESRIRAGGPGAARAAQRALTGVRDLVEDVNKSVENGTRLAVYAALREAGATRIKAASVAKNVTLNFNRKGEAGAGINSLYVFFNASMQGTARLGQVLRTKRGQKLAAGIIAGGWAMDQYNRAAGGDSDKDGTNDWDAIPHWIKERNLILMRGEGKRPVMFPMPYGFNVLHNLGQLVGSTTTGDMTATRAAGSMASSLWNSFNPLGSEADIAQVLSPTALDPIIQHEMNKDFTGRAIRPTRYPGQARPDSELYFRNVPPLARGLAGALNRATGGDKVTPGLISVSPETLDHFFKFFSGGLGRFGSNVANTLTTIAEGKAPELRSVPFARRLVYEEHPGATGMRFRENTEELDTIWARYKHYRETGDRAAAAKLPRSMLRAKKYVDSIEKRIRAIRRAGRAVPNADERIQALQRRANRAIAEARRKAA